MIHLKQKNNCASAESYFDNKKQSIVFFIKNSQEYSYRSITTDQQKKCIENFPQK